MFSTTFDGSDKLMGMKKKGRQPLILKIADSSVVHLNFSAYTPSRAWKKIHIIKVHGFDYVCARKKNIDFNYAFYAFNKCPSMSNLFWQLFHFLLKRIKIKSISYSKRVIPNPVISLTLWFTWNKPNEDHSYQYHSLALLRIQICDSRSIFCVNYCGRY